MDEAEAWAKGAEASLRLAIGIEADAAEARRCHALSSGARRTLLCQLTHIAYESEARQIQIHRYYIMKRSRTRVSCLGVTEKQVLKRSEAKTSTRRPRRASWARCGTCCAKTPAASTRNTFLVRGPRDHRCVLWCPISHGPWCAWTWSGLVGSATRRGWTPLHRAAHKGHLEMAELLLSHGAELEAKDFDGPGSQGVSRPGWKGVGSLMAKHLVQTRSYWR